MAEVLMAAPYIAETEVWPEEQIQFEEELLFPKLDGILFPVVVANADVIAPCQWMEGAEVTLTVALNNYPHVMTEENADEVIADVYEFLAGKIELVQEEYEQELIELLPMTMESEPEIEPNVEVSVNQVSSDDSPSRQNTMKASPKPVRENVVAVQPKKVEVLEPPEKPPAQELATVTVAIEESEPAMLRWQAVVEKIKDAPAPDPEFVAAVPITTTSNEAVPLSMPEILEEVEVENVTLAALLNEEPVEVPEAEPLPVTQQTEEVFNDTIETTSLKEEKESDETADNGDAEVKDYLPILTGNESSPEPNVAELPASEIDAAIEKIDALLTELGGEDDANETEELEILNGLVAAINEVAAGIELEEGENTISDKEAVQENLMELYAALLHAVPMERRKELARILLELTLDKAAVDEKDDEQGISTSSQGIQRKVKGLVVIVRTLRKTWNCIVAIGRSALSLLIERTGPTLLLNGDGILER